MTWDVYRLNPSSFQETGVARCPNRLEKSLAVIGGNSMGSGAIKFTKGSRTLYLHGEKNNNHKMRNLTMTISSLYRDYSVPIEEHANKDTNAKPLMAQEDKKN